MLQRQHKRVKVPQFPPVEGFTDKDRFADIYNLAIWANSDSKLIWQSSHIQQNIPTCCATRSFDVFLFLLLWHDIPLEHNSSP